MLVPKLNPIQWFFLSSASQPSEKPMRRHDHVILSLNTAGFYQRKYPDAEVTALAFGEKYTVENATIELLPTGHILGSA